MSFDRPLLLIGLFAIPLLLWLRSTWLARELKSLRTFVRPVLWEKVSVTVPPPRTLSRMFWSAGIALCILAAAGPVWGTGTMQQASGGSNLVIALDISGSMRSTDEAPTRLGRAAAAIEQLVRGLPDVRLSLVLFASYSRVAVPLTLDGEYFLSRLPREPGDIADPRLGTQIGGLIDVMESAAPEMALESRVGIVFSDGGFHDHEIESTIEAARSSEMPVVTVGVGGNVPAPVPGPSGEPLMTADGDTVKTALEDEVLRRIAEETGGFYAALAETPDLPWLMREMLARSSWRLPELRDAATQGRRFQILLGAGMLFLLAATVLERRRR